MPVSQRDADDMLAEFLAKRSDAPIVKYKRSVKGPRTLSVLPDAFERPTFEPDNSRIGEQSYGLQSQSIAARLLTSGADLDSVARAMVSEYHLALSGIVPTLPTISYYLIGENTNGNNNRSKRQAD
jgi:hypothetical protein